MFSFQEFDLVDEIYCLVQEVTFSFCIQEIPRLLLEPLEIRTIERAFDLLKRSIEMPPGDCNGIIRCFVMFTRDIVPGQFIDDERLYFAHQRLKIGSDKERVFAASSSMWTSGSRTLSRSLR